VLPISRAGREFDEVNVAGTRNVLQAALESRVRKVLNVSTSAVYGIPRSVPIDEQTPLTPLGEYGFAKYAAEQLCRAFRDQHDLDVSIVRPRTLVGAGRLGIFGILFDWIRRGKRVYVIGDGDNLFQMLSARDMAEACCLMTTRPCRNEDFNLGAKEFGTVSQDLEALIAHAGTRARVQPVNALLVRTVLGTLDKLRLSPLVDWHYKTPHKPFYFDIAKAQNLLGWTPRDSNVDMFRDTYDWYLANREKLEGQVGTTHRKSVKQGLLKVLRWFS
jgi:nucleoside-diphosphate-sugar epimerase